jgi:hypothetical protein
VIASSLDVAAAYWFAGAVVLAGLVMLLIGGRWRPISSVASS